MPKGSGFLLSRSHIFDCTINSIKKKKVAKAKRLNTYIYMSGHTIFTYCGTKIRPMQLKRSDSVKWRHPQRTCLTPIENHTAYRYASLVWRSGVKIKTLLSGMKRFCKWSADTSWIQLCSLTVFGAALYRNVSTSVQEVERNDRSGTSPHQISAIFLNFLKNQVWYKFFRQKLWNESLCTTLT